MFRVVIILIMALLAQGVAIGKEPQRANFQVLIEADDCGAVVRAPLRLPLAVGKAIGSKIDGARGSAISLQTTLMPDAKVRVRGSFLTMCGVISPDFTAALGQTVSYRNGKLSISITVTRVGS